MELIVTLFLLYLTSASGSNLALGKPVLMKDTNTLFLPSSGVDGVSLTCIESSTAGAQYNFQWFLVDLMNRYKVESFSLEPISSCCANSLTNFQVVVKDLSPDFVGEKACICKQGININTMDGPTSINCTNICSGRFVHIRSFATEKLTFCEFEVYGSLNVQPRLTLCISITIVKFSLVLIEAEFQLKPNYEIRTPSTATVTTVANATGCSEICRSETTCLGFNYLNSPRAILNCGLINGIVQPRMPAPNDLWVFYMMIETQFCL